MTDYINANDPFRHYDGTDNYYRHFTGMLYTDGVKVNTFLAELVVAYQQKKFNIHYR
jgi:hypothetical protein